MLGACAAGGVGATGDAAVGPDARRDAGASADARSDTGVDPGTDAGADAQADAAVLPHCLDGELSGDESDTDCGGAYCPRCSLGDDCREGTDCASGACTLNLCACAEGYEPGAGETCVDVDECLAGTDDCDPLALCTDTEGSFTCDCPLGYDGDGTVCTDTDECTAGTDDCSAYATCTNLPGSFSCACLPGFTGNGRTCTDENECTNGTAGCGAHATCTNTPGSFSCACDPGYTGDGYTCSATCAAYPDPVAAAMAACQAQFPYCQSTGYLGIVGWNDASCYACNCDPVANWQLFCFGTGYDDWDCGPCELGRIRSAHTIACNCNAGTTAYLGTWCTP
jgi:hypothetical protein